MAQLFLQCAYVLHRHDESHSHQDLLGLSPNEFDASYQFPHNMDSRPTTTTRLVLVCPPTQNMTLLLVYGKGGAFKVWDPHFEIVLLSLMLRCLSSGCPRGLSTMLNLEGIVLVVQPVAL